MYLQNRLLAILGFVSAQFIGCTTATAITLSCNPTDLALPSFPDLQITTLLATPVHNLTAKAQPWIIPPLIYDPSSTIDFCNVTILYTHPGQNDSVTLTVWLPLTRAAWTGRFLGQGGGGWKAGDPAQLSPVVSLGYASASTDAGRNIYGTRDEVVYSSKNWSLRAKGEVNRVWLENFASRALGELAVVGKAVVKAYYGEEARFSYWHGCSTGGRQGMMLAQKFPGAFDGVLAAAPAINWTTFLVVEFWAQLVMKRLGYYPPPCELKAITKAAIEACDGLDGVVDGLVSAPGLCKFNATSVVGQKYDCEGDERTITSAAAEIANAAWTGPSDANGKPVWFGEHLAS
jgi:feruloyl esterase